MKYHTLMLGLCGMFGALSFVAATRVEGEYKMLWATILMIVAGLWYFFALVLWPERDKPQTTAWGQKLHNVQVTVVDTSGQPIEGADVSIWVDRDQTIVTVTHPDYVPFELMSRDGLQNELVVCLLPLGGEV